MDKYRLEDVPFYVNTESNVKLFHGVSLSDSKPVVIKCHEFSNINQPLVYQKISQVINAAIVQAKVHHPHICEILEVQVEIQEDKCAVMHVLEALESDVGADMYQRRLAGQGYSETELTSFLVQTSTALAHSHSLVVLM